MVEREVCPNCGSDRLAELVAVRDAAGVVRGVDEPTSVCDDCDHRWLQEGPSARRSWPGPSSREPFGLAVPRTVPVVAAMATDVELELVVAVVMGDRVDDRVRQELELGGTTVQDLRAKLVAKAGSEDAARAAVVQFVRDCRARARTLEQGFLSIALRGDA